jgi:hypothetical protein
MGVSYHRSVIVEDAVSGVQAGQKGNFGLVIGVAREENSRELLLNGADVVVEDLEETGIDRINEWFEKGLQDDQWSITYHSYDPKKGTHPRSIAGRREWLFRYPRRHGRKLIPMQSTIPAPTSPDCYNRLASKVGDRMVENEDFVNAPNWLPVNFKIDGEDWFDFNKAEFSEFRKHLDFRTGVFTRAIVVKDKTGTGNQGGFKTHGQYCRSAPGFASVRNYAP